MPKLGDALDFAKYEGRNFRGHQLGAAPSSPVTGQLYYNTVDNTFYWWDGTAWVSARGGSGGALPADTVIAAGVRIIANKLLAGDAQPVFRIMGDGKTEWGAGGASALDTNLYRAAADILRTDDTFYSALEIFARIGSTWQMRMGYTPADGGSPGIYFGDANDTVLYRFGSAGANNLKTDGSLWASNSLIVDHANGGGRIYFGGALDTSLYRPAADTLKTDDDFQARSFIANSRATVDDWVEWMNVVGDAGIRLLIQAGGEIIWGGGTDAGDTNLYRDVADKLKTDDEFAAAQSVEAYDGNAAWRTRIGYVGGFPGIAFGGAEDTTLFRSAADTLKTNDVFHGGSTIQSDADIYARVGSERTKIGLISATYPGIGLGVAGGEDTNLYRAAADVLKTDDALAVAGGIGTSLPASPVDGHLFTLVDSLTAPTYAWQFRYVAGISDSNKWVFVGGAPALSAVKTSEGTASTSYADLTTVGPQFTVPRAGVYRVQWGAKVNNGQAPTTMFVAVKIGAAATSDANGISLAENTNPGAWSLVDSQQFTAAASDVLKLQYKTNAGTGVFANRWMQVVPVRVA